MKRTFTKKPVLAATAERSDGYNEAQDSLQANFDYAMDGFEKLARDGKDGEREAMQLMLELNSAIDTVIQNIANTITEQEDAG